MPWNKMPNAQIPFEEPSIIPASSPSQVPLSMSTRIIQSVYVDAWRINLRYTN